MGKQANEYSYPWLEEGEVPPLPLDRDRIHIISQGVADPVFDYDIVPLTYTESRWMAFVVEADEAALKAIKSAGKTGSIKLGTFDMSPGMLKAAAAGEVEFLIDQQQYLQGYLPIAIFAQYMRWGTMPAGVVMTGPGFVTPQNASKVIKWAAQGYR